LGKLSLRYEEPISASKTVLQNLGTDPAWQLLDEHLALLLADLHQDPKYCERIAEIGRLLAHAQFPRFECRDQHPHKLGPLCNKGRGTD
jgi:hypothetical protein